jgi:S-DNA-T family DNA segregation ATPase FtsK/SpoIIIE
MAKQLKRSSSYSKKSPQQTHSDSSFSPSYDVLAVILSVIGVFIVISYFYPQSAGLVGRILKRSGEILFGRSFPAMSIFLFLASYSLVSLRSKRVALWTLAVSFLCLGMALDLRAYSVHHLAWPIPYGGGGVFGYLLTCFFEYLLGPFGIRMVILGSFSATALVLFKPTIRRIFSRLFELVFIPKRGFVDDVFDRPEQHHQPEQPIQKKYAPMVAQVDLPKAAEPIKQTPLPFVEDVKKEPSFTITEHPKLTVKKTAQPQATSSLPYQFPPLTLFDKGTSMYMNPKSMQVLHKQNAALLEETLASFHVDATVVNVTPGPTVTRYELKPGDGVKISKITGLSNDIALKLAAPNVRIEAPIPGKSLIGIEIPNTKTDMISIRDIAERTDFLDHPEKLLAALGVTISGEPVILDLSKMPHLLIAGATGSGKSVCINSIIVSLLLRTSPDEVKMLMIDPKKVELSLYNDIPHLLAPVVTDPNKAAATLKRWALTEMENRYEIFSRVGVKTIAGFNTKIDELKQLALTNEAAAKKQWDNLINQGDESIESITFNPKKLPYIVVVIDELADLMMVASQDVESTICRLAQMARATGIHLVIATQRPSVNVITGLIKANVPSRISFYLQSQIDSRTVLDMGGAEKLLGKGDMLYSPVGSFKPQRLQGVFISEKEIKNIVDFVKTQSKPEYLSEIIDIEPLNADSSSDDSEEDELFSQAKEIVQTTQYASTSFLQRKLRIGYNRAARLMDDLKAKGIVNEYTSQSKPVVKNDGLS